MRKVAVVFLAISAMAFAACSDDSTTPVKPDTKAKKPDSSTTLPPDNGVPVNVDKNVTPNKEASTTKVDGAASSCGTPFQAKANSGKSCTADTDCTTDEYCVGMPTAAGGQIGMCLGKCCANEANQQDPVNTCPTGTVTNPFSICGLQLQDQSGNPAGMSCVWLCSVTQSGTTTTFDCPDATNYDCVDSGATGAQTYSFCVPKK